MIEPLTKISLFSGIGGDDLASEAVGIETVCFVEKDAYCQRVLAYHWPNIPIIGEVHELTKETFATTIANGCRRQWVPADKGQESPERRRAPEDGEALSDAKIVLDQSRGTRQGEWELGGRNQGKTVDIVAGGFPCQPHSIAGKRKAASDERDLWPEFRRIIGDFRPRWIVAENVPGLLSSDLGRFFGSVLTDLASMGYSVGWCTFGAVDVGAWHKRDRVFIVGYAGERGLQGDVGRRTGEKPTRRCPTLSDSAIKGLERSESTRSIRALGLSAECGPLHHSDERRRQQCKDGQGGQFQQSNAAGRSTQSGVGDLANGLPGWLAEPSGVPRVITGAKDRVNKLKALGNAVVPAQIYPIYKMIVEVEGSKQECHS